jgi:hypothetical protein
MNENIGIALMFLGALVILGGIKILKTENKPEPMKNTLWVQKPFFTNIDTKTGEVKTAQIGLQDGGIIVWCWTPEAKAGKNHDLDKPIDIGESKK